MEKYNECIITLRKKEFVYSAWVHKYWGSGQSQEFETFMESVRQFDKAIHSINDELGKIQDRKSETIAPKRASEAMELMEPAAMKLRKAGYSFLISLN